MVLATNSGVSAVLDSTGRIIAEAPSGKASVLSARVAWLETSTPFQRIGELPWFVIAAIMGVLSFIPRAILPKPPHRTT